MNRDVLNHDENSGAVRANEIMEKLGAYVDGELPPKEREDIETLLERDRSCRDAVQWFRFLDDAAKREEVPSVNAGEWAGIWEEIQRRKELPVRSLEPTPASESKRHGNVFASRWFLGVAAAAAVVVLAFIGLRMLQPSDTGENIAQPGTSMIDTVEEPLDGKAPDEDREDKKIKIGEVPDEIGEHRDF